MFITFHKQVSVIKKNLLITLNTPPLPNPFSPLPFSLSIDLFSRFSFPFPSFYFFLQKSCDILCIFKQLIRVLLCFNSRSYEYCCRRCCCCSRCRYLRKSFYQKRHFFVTRNYEKRYNTCSTQCTSLPCLSYKRRETKKLS